MTAQTRIVPHPLGTQVGYSVRLKVFPGFWTWVKTGDLFGFSVIQSWQSEAAAQEAIDGADMSGVRNTLRWVYSLPWLLGLAIIGALVAYMLST